MVHVNNKFVMGVVAASLIVLPACGGSSPSSPPAAPGPSSAASVSTPTASATPTPAASKAQDLAAAKRAIITTALLGKPWVQPKTVNTTRGKTDEACPGTPTLDKAAPPQAKVVASFTQGKARGASIARFSVATVPEGGGDTYRRGWLQTYKSCASFRDGAGLYVVTSTEGPTSIVGADDVLSRAERLYYDAKHKQLVYARHIVSARTGRAISTVEYSFLTSKSDPTAKDFTVAQRLLAAQLARTRAVFAQ